MNILGVGPAELIVILIIMLVVAGPKRMIEWAYQAGKYAAQLRAMFQETMDAFHKELAQSGIDMPKDLTKLPTGRFDIVSEAAKVINSELAETSAALNSTLTTTPTTPPAAPPSPPAAPETPTTPDSETHTATTDDEQSTRYDAWTPS
jgi:sec-independent protein translocase protein TatB